MNTEDEDWAADKELYELRDYIVVLEARLKAIHGAVQLSIDKNLLIDCDCEFCIRLRFILEESDLTPRDPFTAPLSVEVAKFMDGLPRDESFPDDDLDHDIDPSDGLPFGDK
jgi:hypothetical protein